MSQYRVIKKIDFGTGFLHDRTGNAVPMQNFAPKIGDIIKLGEPKKIYLMGSSIEGYDFIVKQEGVSPDSKLFIPADAVKRIGAAVGEKASIESDKIIPVISGALIGGGAGYFVSKRYNKNSIVGISVGAIALGGIFYMISDSIKNK